MEDSNVSTIYHDSFVQKSILSPSYIKSGKSSNIVTPEKEPRRNMINMIVRNSDDKMEMYSDKTEFNEMRQIIFRKRESLGNKVTVNKRYSHVRSNSMFK
jgi:hypothetical protein